MRLFTAFFILVVPIYLIGIGIFNAGKDLIEKEIIKENTSETAFFLENIEREVLRLKVLETDCLGDISLNDLAVNYGSMSPYERVSDIERLTYRLETIENSSPYAADVTVYIRAAEIEVSSTRGFSRMSREESERHLGLQYESAPAIDYRDGRMYLCLPYPNYYHNTDPYFVIEIELSASKIENKMASLSASDTEAFIMIDRAGRFVISNAENDSIGEIAEHKDRYVSALLSGKRQFTIHGNSIFMTYSESDTLGIFVVKYSEYENVFRTVENYKTVLWIFLCSSPVFFILYYYILQKVINNPLQVLLHSFSKVEEGDLNVTVSPKHFDDEFQYLFDGFNKMVQKLNGLIEQNYKSKIMAQRAELKQLQAQINPHFLYNCFFMLSTMVQMEDYDNIKPFTDMLGKYFEFIARNTCDDVPLSKEVDFVRVYTEIQAMRFANRVTVSFGELPEEAADVVVPRLILQPIVENAFQYGIENRSGTGAIRIGFESLPLGLQITVEDSGNTITDRNIQYLQEMLKNEDFAKETTGIINVDYRLRLKNGPGSGISVSRSPLGGLKVVVSIGTGGGEKNVQNADRR